MKCQQLVLSANKNGNCDVVKFFLVIVIYRHLVVTQPSVIVILVLLCVSLRRQGGVN